ncbi:MAG: hypothetical protein C0510_13120 [Erythrobacter sp.]|nr:hypothetical protein [Erythrobacter sp.]MBA4165544.1 hypothetical protein [Erythrobacter sp.]
MVFGKWLGGSDMDHGKAAPEEAGGLVWVSSVLSNYDIGMKQGSRTKFYGHRWNPASLELPLSPPEMQANSIRHMQGSALARSEFPEAEAVWDEKRFKKIKDIFMVGPFYGVKGKLADTLARFDLGEGGLIPFTVFKADLETPYPGEFFLLNFGCLKNTVLPEQSRNVIKFSVHHETGLQKWEVNSWSEDGDVVVSRTVLDGPDLWFDPAIYNKIFMSDAMAQALIAIGMGDVFKLKRCAIA